ncbi:hypothetical protein SAMN04490179_4083 [Pseudomonas antarctica]|uniref:Polymerase beta nucleotidyltransferase domain-containing protein n=2 Tax=Pseudomonas antarctica TaxID=219572 RepID=A0A1H0B3V8_9PSED|nr:hypothetical protein PSAN_56750 [Pseudomonas antarctica]SDN40312.1 hypothetical protein SAMN04490179_4083 [Pseudomonas antarctica]
MAIMSMALYGSRARNDHTLSSDTDLFAITNDDRYRMVFHGATNVACYPFDLAMSRAEGGDLFFLHIVREAVVIYDPDSSFDRVRSAFKLRPNYNIDISRASDLGFALLLNIENFKNYFYINKRLVWCLRTILIALSAERGTPVFSTKELVSMFDDEDIELLLSAKREPGYVPDVYKIFKQKIALYGKTNFAEIPNDFFGQLRYFTEQGNSMAKKTIYSIIKNLDGNDYT